MRRAFLAAAAGLVVASSALVATPALAVTASNGARCTIVGGAGDDVLKGSGRQDVICGLGGNDRIYGYDGADILDGGPGNDQLFGGPGPDTLLGGLGRDTLTGGRGANTLRGGDGVDKVSYADRTSGIVADLDGVRDDGAAPASAREFRWARALTEYDLIAGDVEGLIGGSGSDSLTGSGGANSLTGGDGADTLTGGGGADRLLGGAGGDTLTGGAGNDYLNGGLAPDSMDGGTGTNTCIYTAEDLVQPNCDSRAPVVVGTATITPASIDTSAAPRTVHVQVRVTDDLAGVGHVCVALMPTTLLNGGYSTGVPCVDAPTTGTVLDGVYDLDVTLQQWAWQGLWDVKVTAGDLAGNDTGQIAVGTVNQTGVGDTSSPALVSITPSTTSVDTSAASRTISFDLRLSDDVSGVDVNQVGLMTWGPQRQQVRNDGPFTMISGTLLDGVWRGTLTLPRYAEPGDWGIFVLLKDRAGNFYMRPDDTPELVIRQTGAGDGQPPVFVSASPTTATVVTSAQVQEVTLDVRVTDNLAGVDRVFLDVTGPSGQTGSASPKQLISGNALDGVYRFTVYIPVYAQPGTWTIDIQSFSDLAANRGYRYNIATVQVT